MSVGLRRLVFGRKRMSLPGNWVVLCIPRTDFDQQTYYVNRAGASAMYHVFARLSEWRLGAVYGASQ